MTRYNQATAMCRHYKQPILLIEFDESRSFSLQVMNVKYYPFTWLDYFPIMQSTSSIQSEISNQSVASKLVLLTLHFPNVLAMI